MARPGRLKRALDLAIAIPAFIITLPIQALAAVLVLASMGRPILFTQQRPGLHGKPFAMRKFRTMRPFDAERGWTDDSTRLTNTGRFLRSTSIDELPTLLNIIRGDMSLVGPRPLLMSYMDRYTSEQARRMEVKPGMTGLAQISGRNNQTWAERFQYDLQYVDNQSLLLDLEIIGRTFMVVLRRRGVAYAGSATMPEFRGLDG